MYREINAVRLSRSRIWFYYTILFLSVGFIIFFQFALCRKTLIWDTDGYLQWYALLAKVKSIALDLWEGSFQLWSWDTGLGSDLIGNYALVLCDPFNYVAVFFPNAHLDIAYSVIIILKLYVAGLVVLGFLRYHKKSDGISLLCALGYGFCTWALICLRHEFFLNSLILFPLLIWGVDRVDDRKSPTVLILGIMASVVTSLYFSYMSAIFVVLYVIIKYFLKEGEKTVRDFVLRLLRYIGYAVTGGVLLAGPILIPVLYTLLQASTGSGVDTQILPGIKQLLRFLPSFAGRIDINYNDSIPGISMLFVLMVPAMILLWRKKLISIYLFFLSAIFAIFPLAQSVMNGFSYSSGRWCYVLVFFFIYAASDCMESEILHSPKYKKGTRIWLGILLANTLLASLFNVVSTMELLVVLVNLCFGFFLFPMLSAEHSKDRNSASRRNILIIALANIAVLPLIAYWPTLGNGMGAYMKHGACYNAYESSAMKEVSSIHDNDFYRVDTVDSKGNNGAAIREAHTPANANIYWQVPSISEYLSTVDENWIKFNQQLDNSAGAFRRMCVYSNDNRSRMDFLQGIRYFIATDSDAGKQQSGYAGYGFAKKEEKDGIKILEAPYKTGLGYVLDQTMAESDFLQYSALEREQVLMQCAVMNDEDMETISAEKSSVDRADRMTVQTKTETIPATVCTGTGQPVTDGSLTVKQAGMKLTVTPEQEIKNSEVYLIFKNFHKELMYPGQIWQFEQENGNAVNSISRLQFYSNYLSYTPYENFSVLISNSVNQVVKRIVNAAGEPQGIRGNENYMVNLGYYDSFDGEILCNFGTIGNYTFDGIEVAAVPIDNFKQQAETLSQNRLEITANEGDYLKGTVNAEKDGILYLSILYTPGWNIYVDGKKTDTYRVNTAFTGVQVDAGQHEVELVYHPVGYPYSFLLFAVGLLLTVSLAVYFRKRKSGGVK